MFMYLSEETRSIIDQMTETVLRLFPQEHIDVILYGSYARNENTADSDIDVLYLVDSSREEIAEKRNQVCDTITEIIFEHSIFVSPLIENRDFFLKWLDVMPFFQNIKNEGVYLEA